MPKIGFGEVGTGRKLKYGFCETPCSAAFCETPCILVQFRMATAGEGGRGEGALTASIHPSIPCGGGGSGGEITQQQRYCPVDIMQRSE